jgi:cysteinyl-tRNA synthetase
VHYPGGPTTRARVDRHHLEAVRQGHAYHSEDGSVYFSIAKWPAYGKLANLDRAGMRAAC